MTGWWARHRCVHDWDVRVRVIVEPKDVKVGEFSGSRNLVVEYTRTIERIIAGQTSVILTCQKCGALEERVMLGVPEEVHVTGAP